MLLTTAIIINTVIGIAALIVGYKKHQKIKSFISSASQISGEVIDLKYDDDVYRPLISVRLPDGKSETFYSEIASSRSKFKVGDPVRVLYSPSSETKLIMDDKVELWMTVVVCYFFALVGISSLLILPIIDTYIFSF